MHATAAAIHQRPSDRDGRPDERRKEGRTEGQKAVVRRGKGRGRCPTLPLPSVCPPDCHRHEESREGNEREIEKERERGREREGREKDREREREGGREEREKRERVSKCVLHASPRANGTMGVRQGERPTERPTGPAREAATR